jgi:hypothetical protein
MITLALSTLVVVLPGSSLAKPSRLATFIAEREICDHFRGEEAYDKARARFIAAKLKRYCTGTDRRLKALRARYAKHPKVLAKLADYEDSIE